MLPFTTLGRPPMRLPVLGDAVGPTAGAYGRFFAATSIDRVEPGGHLIGIGRRFFDRRGPHLPTITAEGRPFARSPGPRYAAIMIDAHYQPSIPFYLSTRESSPRREAGSPPVA